MASLWKHLLLLTVAIVTASAQKGVPEIGGDVVFVVQKGANYAEVSQNMKDFMKKMAVTSAGEIAEDEKVMFRPAVITYDGEANVEFDIDSGNYMNKVSKLTDAIDDMPSDISVPGANLGGALMLAADMLDQQSQPYRNRVVVVITDGQHDGNMNLFNNAVDRLRTWNTYVVVLDTSTDEDGVGQDNIATMLNGDMSWRYRCDLRVHVDIWWSGFYNFCGRRIIIIVIKICIVIEIGPCSRPMGVGWRFVSKRCWFGIVMFNSIRKEHCCIEPFPVGDPPGPPGNCKNYPPANGSL